MVLKELIFTVSTVGVCCGLERIEFSEFLLLEGVVVLKELTFNSWYFGSMWWS